MSTGEACDGGLTLRAKSDDEADESLKARVEQVVSGMFGIVNIHCESEQRVAGVHNEQRRSQGNKNMNVSLRRRRRGWTRRAETVRGSCVPAYAIFGVIYLLIFLRINFQSHVCRAVIALPTREMLHAAECL